MAWWSWRRYLLQMSWFFSFHWKKRFEFAYRLVYFLSWLLRHKVLICSTQSYCFDQHCYFLHITALLHIRECFSCEVSNWRGISSSCMSDCLAHYIHSLFIEVLVWWGWQRRTASIDFSLIGRFMKLRREAIFKERIDRVKWFVERRLIFLDVKSIESLWMCVLKKLGRWCWCPIYRRVRLSRNSVQS